ncbi:unnamed protein product [Brassica oleracea var. botrytis]|uniref:(rape) hypothetical protein n=1 Tax=Brassica napus TaxID=3708 RepID=A0A816U7I8_BRANA|nr:unnamed protein product [Brassica napus]
MSALNRLAPLSIREPIEHPPSAATRTNIDTVMSHDGTASKLPVTQTRKPAGVLKRNVPKSPDEKAARASRKLNAARGRTSLKVKKGNTSKKLQSCRYNPHLPSWMIIFLERIKPNCHIRQKHRPVEQYL